MCALILYCFNGSISVFLIDLIQFESSKLTQASLI